MPGFEVGDYGGIGEIGWAVQAGRKKVGDKVLWIVVPVPTPVPMSLGFLLADFLAENEDLLYPPSLGHEGGKMYLRYLKKAANVGWEKVAAELDAQRRAKGIQQTFSPNGNGRWA